MLDAWSQLVALASAVPAGGAPALAKPAAMETFVMAPLRAVAGRRAPGSNRTGTLHARLIEPVRLIQGLNAALTAAGGCILSQVASLRLES